MAVALGRVAEDEWTSMTLGQARGMQINPLGNVERNLPVAAQPRNSPSLMVRQRDPPRPTGGVLHARAWNVGQRECREAADEKKSGYSAQWSTGSHLLIACIHTGCSKECLQRT